MKDLVQNFHFWPPKIEQFSVPKTQKKKKKKKKEKKERKRSYSGHLVHICGLLSLYETKIKIKNFFSNRNSKKFSRITSIDTTFQDFQSTTSFTLCTNASQVLPYVQTYPNVKLRKK